MATQTQRRQIADGAINDLKIGSDAAIATNKLADGANFIKRDGSVPFTGNVDAGNNRVVNVGTPTGNNDATPKSYVDNAIAGVTSLFTNKGTVRVATTANITLSGTQTIDGISVAVGDRVLVKNQTSASQNGLYTVASGSWVRALDMDVWGEVPGGWVTVQQGSTQADTVWLSTADQGGTLETTAITFVNPLSGVGAGLLNSNFVDKEVPSGSINGSNTAFTLANTPVTGSEHLYLNGTLQEAGSGNDYTISGASITLATAPLAGEKIRVSYRK